jgi:hypothetical protein
MYQMLYAGWANTAGYCIPVHNVFAVCVVHERQQRLHNADCILLTELPVRHDLIKQLAALAQLHDLQDHSTAQRSGAAAAIAETHSDANRHIRHRFAACTDTCPVKLTAQAAQ